MKILAKAARRDTAPEGSIRTARRPQPDPEAGMSVRGKTVRTWCVRACDGFYFPISYSTTKDHLQTDQATCQAMCPAAEAALYYHDADDGGPENMTSLGGEPYSDLASAFLYRTVIDRSCTCTAGGPAPLLEAERKEPETAGLEPPLPPKPRPAPDEDPETLANRAGRFVPGPVGTAVASADRSLGQSVRVVWPDWQSQQSEVMISAVPGF